MHILNGIPLPKGHGDLIDRSVLRQRNYDTGFDIVVSIADIDNAPPIIEADKEREV